jgi:hypothetical protein
VFVNYVAAMVNLVQIETAIRSFFWEPNLNGTHIQSQDMYLGVLSDKEIAKAIGRVESVMSLAMSLVSVYTN